MPKYVTSSGVVTTTSEAAARAIGYKAVKEPAKKAAPKEQDKSKSDD